MSSIVPTGSTVLEIGCGTGDLIAHLKPKRGVGIDFSEGMIRVARERHRDLAFCVGDAEALPITGTFDYVILSHLIGHLTDIWQALKELRRVTRPDSYVIITYSNSVWRPFLRLAEWLRLQPLQGRQNWLSGKDIENLLDLHGYETIIRGTRLLLPSYIPFLSPVVNRVLANLPWLKRLCLIGFIVARVRGPNESQQGQLTCSVVVPCKNEAGNIESCVERIPVMGSHTEIIFVDGNSNDGTPDAILKWIERYRGKKDIKLISQGGGTGKADAVSKGFAVASGDVLMILDADLQMAPEDLPKFYLAIAEKRGEIISASRFVYPLEGRAVRMLNRIGNKVFSLAFGWIAGQRVADVLSGMKVLLRRDYWRLVEGGRFFGNLDSSGEFDMLFSGVRLDMKITEIPVRCRERTYGVTKIKRFRHGWLLLRMCWIGLWKLKLR